jgi:hypothetical protein
MNRYLIYSVTTGIIDRIVTCPWNQALDQLRPGEALYLDMTGVVTDVSHRVEGEDLIQIPPLPPPEPSVDQIRTGLIAAAQRHLDAHARSWGYDDLRSAVTYVGDPYPRFNAEGLALRNWRSAVWAWLDAAKSQPLPDPIPTREEFLAMLPSAPSRPVV